MPLAPPVVPHCGLSPCWRGGHGSEHQDQPLLQAARCRPSAPQSRFLLPGTFCPTSSCLELSWCPGVLRMRGSGAGAPRITFRHRSSSSTTGPPASAVIRDHGWAPGPRVISSTLNSLSLTEHAPTAHLVGLCYRSFSGGFRASSCRSFPRTPGARMPHGKAISLCVSAWPRAARGRLALLPLQRQIAPEVICGSPRP